MLISFLRQNKHKWGADFTKLKVIPVLHDSGQVAIVRGVCQFSPAGARFQVRQEQQVCKLTHAHTHSDAHKHTNTPSRSITGARCRRFTTTSWYFVYLAKSRQSVKYYMHNMSACRLSMPSSAWKRRTCTGTILMPRTTHAAHNTSIHRTHRHTHIHTTTCAKAADRRSFWRSGGLHLRT